MAKFSFPFFVQMQFINLAQFLLRIVLFKAINRIANKIVNISGRIRRKVFNESDVEKLLSKAPSRRYAGSSLFRKMDDVGIISFTEYLFLLSVLTSLLFLVVLVGNNSLTMGMSFDTVLQLLYIHEDVIIFYNSFYILFNWIRVSEPKNGFRIAFNMFDRDGNQRVDRREFLVVGILGVMNVS